MKIIFSRKGFDSGFGGVPSPILTGAGPVSLPIPSEAGAAARRYQVAGLGLGPLMAQLTGGRHGDHTLVHFDPALSPAGRHSCESWRPALGQVGAAQSHLANQSVGVGDLFLFFGWFRPAEIVGRQCRYRAGSSSFHAVFGWLQVGEMIEIPSGETGHVPDWLADHPHVVHARRFRGLRNTVYVASDRLRLDGKDTGLPGGGRFSSWTEDLRLSADGANRSLWRVPDWMEPRAGRTALSYHRNPARWHQTPGGLRLRTVHKGQEFVLDSTGYPEARAWARELIERHARASDSGEEQR